MSEDIGNVMPTSGSIPKATRGVLQIASIAPIVGGFLSALAGAWSEHEQEKVNKFFEQWLKMLQDEFKEKEQTIIEIIARLDMQDEKVKERLASPEYQALMRKTFREWAGAESEEKRKFIRNILANAAGSNIASDDVLRLFIDWMRLYSELHFKVIGAIYNTNGITRGGIWRKLGRKPVREDSSDADLYKLLIRDLSTGGIIRQHRETDYNGNFAKKSNSGPRGPSSPTMKSAFDNEEGYELTNLGKEFVHYAMTDLPLKIAFNSTFQKEKMADN